MSRSAERTCDSAASTAAPGGPPRRSLKYLIVNGDDFGLSAGVNRGMITAYERGIVTSVSLMVRGRATSQAARYCREHPDLSAGLHLDLGEWVCRDHGWEKLYDVVRLDDRAAVEKEVRSQWEQFRALTGQDPTHIDSHQHVHLGEPVRSLAGGLAARLGVPLRGCSDEVHYCGHFYGQTAEGESYPDLIGVENLLGILETLPSGITELGCHPGEGDDLDTMYRDERAREVETLCDPRVREVINAAPIELCSFRHLVDGAEGTALDNQEARRKSGRVEEL